jgi:DMSO reductase family type II enzyme heme b subunit
VARLFKKNGSPKGTIALTPGTSSKIAFAVWQGGAQERAGLKAFSADWQELELDA